MPLDPQVAALLEAMASLDTPRMEDLSPPEARRVYAAMAAARTSEDPLAGIEDRVIAGPGGELRLRVYRPEGDGPLPVVAFFHGGGWVIGDLESHDALCRSLASRSGSVVVAVDYRLAPEAPFPGPLEDCYTATAWIVDHAEELVVDPTRLAVAGDSAGGNLAAALCILARERGGPDIGFQLLVYPVTDHTFSQASYIDNAEGYFLTGTAMRWFSAHYLGGAAVGEEADPLAAPLRAPDVSGLPSALVITAEYDPLRDEGEAYGERLKAAGVEATVVRYDGMIHGFVSMAGVLDRGAEAVEVCAAALMAAGRR